MNKGLLQILFSAFLLFGFGIHTAHAQGYNLKFKMEGVTDEFAVIAKYVGTNQYIQDTIFIDKEGWYSSESTDTLDGGLYMMYFPKIARSFDFMITDKEPNLQQFSMETDTLSPVTNMKVKGSAE
ncbi:MAG: hypothetical protein AAFV80_06500, partial [Bacteroidota bacterium]